MTIFYGSNRLKNAVRESIVNLDNNLWWDEKGLVPGNFIYMYRRLKAREAYLEDSTWHERMAVALNGLSDSDADTDTSIYEPSEADDDEL